MGEAMTKEQLIKQIAEAFSDVKLGNGIGLYEADCLDAYLDPSSEEYGFWKRKDERDNWLKLMPILLHTADSPYSHGSPGFPGKRWERWSWSSNWCFMDAEGRRFILPCYLIRELEKPQEYDNPIVFALTDDDASRREFLALLTGEQKKALIAFIEYQIDAAADADDIVDFEDYQKCLSILRLQCPPH
jgi:hypothetical protein